MRRDGGRCCGTGRGVDMVAPLDRGRASQRGTTISASGAQNADMVEFSVETHAVTNQPPPLVGYDVFGSDAVLVEAVERFGAGDAAEDLSRLGRLSGSE